MPSHLKIDSPRTVAFIDLGTNSVRFLLVRINPNAAYTILSQQKEMIRLGAGEFSSRRLQPEAMDRAILVLGNFARMAHNNRADEIVAVATSATREAKNRDEFIERIQREAGIKMRVISGREEARLIQLGVASGMELSGQRTFFLDIGGGSTEVIVGDGDMHVFLDSMKIGAIRLANRFTQNHTGPISQKRYDAIREHVRSVVVRVVHEIRAWGFERAVGSSGTIENLAEIAAKNIGDPADREYAKHLRRDDLDKTIKLLRSLPLEARKDVNGINLSRADIIVPGAAILDVMMKELSLKQIAVSDRGLKEGILADYIARSEVGSEVRDLGVRQRSVLQLGRGCAFAEEHARTVTRISRMLFDSGKKAGLHNLGDWERELLEHAAMLHDIGAFISYNNHHAHSYYIIRNADLLGFNQEELDIVAATAFFHRKFLPSKREHPEYTALTPKGQKAVTVLCILLRIAESLDRSHGGMVKNAEFKPGANNDMGLELTAPEEARLEVWGARKHIKAFEKTFNKTLHIDFFAGGSPN